MDGETAVFYSGNYKTNRGAYLERSAKSLDCALRIGWNGDAPSVKWYLEKKVTISFVLLLRVSTQKMLV